MDYVSVEEARRAPGLRIAFTKGVPGPWSVAVRTFYDVKNIPYTAVVQVAGDANEALREWTGQTSAPVAVLNDERPRAHWSELLLLAERLAPDPPLVPQDEDERIQMFGLCHELCGEDGLGWNLRLIIFAAQRASGHVVSSALQEKYSSDTSDAQACARVDVLLAMLDRRLAEQASKGSAFLVGNRFSAADIYWAAFSNLLVAMPEEICPMPDFYRGLGSLCSRPLRAPVSDALIAHRDRIVRDYFRVPILF